MARNILRIDLTDYREYIEILRDRLNEDSILKMSMTDVVKIAIEKAVAPLLPDMIINKKRKKYSRLEF